jgi:hypothetical protein
MRRFNGAANGASNARANSAVSPAGTDRQNTAEAVSSSPAAVVTSVASFGENLLTLSELQARLTAVELRRNVDAMKGPAMLLVGGVAVAVAGFPVLFIGVAELLASELGLTRGFAFLIASAAAVVIGGTLVVIADQWLRRSRLGLPLAAEELNRNMSWLRTILRQSGRWTGRI